MCTYRLCEDNRLESEIVEMNPTCQVAAPITHDPYLQQIMTKIFQHALQVDH
jgi:hypothetical protein